MILENTDSYRHEFVADAHLTPTAAVGQTVRDLINQYIASISNPNAIIAFGYTKLGVQPSQVFAAFSSRRPNLIITFGYTKLGVQPSLVVAFFSSRGPNQITPDIFIPNMIAPSVNILLVGHGHSLNSDFLDKGCVEKVTDDVAIDHEPLD
ncbi:hypothetical protein BC332_02044 [Capsicum chinense]|nr:hypothetical protein BC332_02044 [Capsicum chinense]